MLGKFGKFGEFGEFGEFGVSLFGLVGEVSFVDPSSLFNWLWSSDLLFDFYYKRKLIIKNKFWKKKKGTSENSKS